MLQLFRCVTFCYNDFSAAPFHTQKATRCLRTGSATEGNPRPLRVRAVPRTQLPTTDQTVTRYSVELRLWSLHVRWNESQIEIEIARQVRYLAISISASSFLCFSSVFASFPRFSRDFDRLLFFCPGLALRCRVQSLG